MAIKIKYKVIYFIRINLCLYINIKTDNIENVSSPWDWDTPSSKALDSLSASLNPKVSVNHSISDDSVKYKNLISAQEKYIDNNLNSIGKNINITDDSHIKEKLISKKSKIRQKNKSLDFFGLSSSESTNEVDNESTSFGGIRLPHINIGYNLDNTFSFFDDIDDIDLNEDRILKQINDFNSRGTHYLFLTHSLIHLFTRLFMAFLGANFGPFNFSEIPSINTYSILNMYNNDRTAPQ